MANPGVTDDAISGLSESAKTAGAAGQREAGAAGQREAGAAELGDAAGGRQGGAGRSLWRHRDFMLLWAGQSISELGSSVTVVALPLTAVLLLHASTFQVGLLTAAGTACFLLVALPAGLVVDRVRKRRLMLGCDVARTVIVGSVVVAAALGILTMAQLFVVALLAGLATVFFDVAYQSYVPSLIGHSQLHEGNGKIGISQSFAQVAGPGLGGALFGLLKASSMTLDAASFAVSAASLWLIRSREPQPARSEPAGKPDSESGTEGGKRAQRTAFGKELFAGLRFVLTHKVLRKIAGCTGTANLFGAMAFALQVIFLVRVVHLRPAGVGVLLGIGSLGGIVGSLVSRRLSSWIGTARIIWFSILVFGAVPIIMPLTATGWRLVLFPIAGFGLSFTAVVYNIAQLSYRQIITPPELLGRMNAAIRWIVWGTLPLGGLIGGVLGSAGVLGVRPTLWLSVVGSWAAGFWVLFSPLRGMRDIPPHEKAGSADSASVQQLA